MLLYLLLMYPFIILVITFLSDNSVLYLELCNCMITMMIKSDKFLLLNDITSYVLMQAKQDQL